MNEREEAMLLENLREMFAKARADGKASGEARDKKDVKYVLDKQKSAAVEALPILHNLASCGQVHVAK